MTATEEELCRLLDERGVEWDSIGADVSWFDARGWTVDANGNTRGGELLCVTAYMTPEQAIAATLGAGTKADAENAKLRKIVGILYELVEKEYPYSFFEEAAELMRELGMEVVW